MGLDRAFDDARWPEDDTGKAECFMCGKKVDPLDPRRGTYTPNAAACEPLPAHLSCLAGDADHMIRVRVAAMNAINTMGQANVKRMREAARCEV